MCLWWCFKKPEIREPLIKEVRFQEPSIDSRDYTKTTLKYNFIISCFDNDIYQIKKYLLTIDLYKDKELASRALQIAYINNNINMINILLQNGASIEDLPEMHQYKITAMMMPEV